MPKNYIKTEIFFAIHCILHKASGLDLQQP